MPTSRSLSLVLLPELKVLREYGPEKGAIVSRLAPSFLRIGSFEMLNPPTDQFMFFYSRPAYEKPKPEWDNLRLLGAFVRRKLGMGAGTGTWEMVREVTRRNARMVAGWQAWGFQVRSFPLLVLISRATHSADPAVPSFSCSTESSIRVSTSIPFDPSGLVRLTVISGLSQTMSRSSA